MELFHRLGPVCLNSVARLQTVTVRWYLHMLGFSVVVSELHKLGCCQDLYHEN